MCNLAMYSSNCLRVKSQHEWKSYACFGKWRVRAQNKKNAPFAVFCSACFFMPDLSWTLKVNNVWFSGGTDAPSVFSTLDDIRVCIVQQVKAFDDWCSSFIIFITWKPKLVLSCFKLILKYTRRAGILNHWAIVYCSVMKVNCDYHFRSLLMSKYLSF